MSVLTVKLGIDADKALAEAAGRASDTDTSVSINANLKSVSKRLADDYLALEKDASEARAQE